MKTPLKVVALKLYLTEWIGQAERMVIEFSESTQRIGDDSEPAYLSPVKRLAWLKQSSCVN